MNRAVLAWVAIAAVCGAVLFGWRDVRRQREFRRLVAVGESALAHDQTFGAVEAFTSAITLRPDAMLGWLKRGDTYRRRAEYVAALRDLHEAIRLDPTAARAIELLGDVHAAMDDPTKAIDQYRRYLALDDRAAPVVYKLALAQYRRGDVPAAADTARRAIALSPDLVEAHHLLGMTLRDLERPADAIGAWTRAITLAPTFTPAREELANLYLELGRRREGLEQLEALAALEPARPERLVGLALAYARTGRREVAILAVQRAIEKFPESPVVHLGAARVWLDAAEAAPDRAAVDHTLHALDTAEALGGSSPEILALRGRALYLSGDVAGAERVLQQATARPPFDAAAFRYLATASQRLGHETSAHEARARYEALTADR